MKKTAKDAKKESDECFLCDRLVKSKQFTFFSGVMKGGTTHRMLSCTVTFFERWSDLTMHEIQVCRECQLRLWQEKQFPPLVLLGGGAALAALVALVGVVLLPGAARIAVGALAGVAALALGGLFVVQLQQYQSRKPKQAQLEPLVIREAKDRLPDEGHTYMTSEQYIERHEKGIIE